MVNYSKVYFQLCNSGNAINRVIDTTCENSKINEQSKNIREQIARLIEFVALEAEFEQSEKLAEMRCV